MDQDLNTYAYEEMLGAFLNERREDGSRAEHHRRIVDDVLEPCGIKITGEMLIGTDLHDFLPRLIEESGGNFQNSQALTYLLSSVYSQGDPEEWLMGISFAQSAMELEQFAEKRRAKYLNSLLHLQRKENPANTFTLSLQSHLSEVATLGSVSPEEVTNAFIQVLNDHESPVPNYLKEFRPDTINFHLLDEIQDLSLGGIYIKIAEAIDNLHNPNPKRPGAGFIDAIEMLGLYAPLAELTGNLELAAMSYNAALQYLNPEIDIQVAARMFEINQLQLRQISPKLTPIIENYCSPDSIETRVKYPGSAHEKITAYRRQGKQFSELGDMIGFRGTIEDEDVNILSTTESLVRDLVTTGFKIQSPSNGQGEQLGIEISWDSVDSEREHSFNVNGQEIHAVLTPPRGIGKYQAVHINLAGGIELQVTTEGRHETNQFGQASHLIYKASKGSGPIATALGKSRDKELSPLEQNQARIKADELITQAVNRIQRFRFNSQIREEQGFLTLATADKLTTLISTTLGSQALDVQYFTSISFLTGGKYESIGKSTRIKEFNKQVTNPWQDITNFSLLAGEKPPIYDNLRAKKLKERSPARGKVELVIPPVTLDVGSLGRELARYHMVPISQNDSEWETILAVVNRTRTILSHEKRKDGSDYVDGHILPSVSSLAAMNLAFGLGLNLNHLYGMILHETIESERRKAMVSGFGQLKAESASINDLSKFLEFQGLDTRTIMGYVTGLTKKAPFFFTTREFAENDLFLYEKYVAEGVSDQAQKGIREYCYKRQIQNHYQETGDVGIVIMKLIDRLTNHVSDLNFLASETPIDYQRKRQIQRYSWETITYYSDLFMEIDNPAVLRNLLAVLSLIQEYS